MVLALSEVGGGPAAAAGSAESRPACPIMISRTASVLARIRGHAPVVRSAIVGCPLIGPPSFESLRAGSGRTPARRHWVGIRGVSGFDQGAVEVAELQVIEVASSIG